MSSRLPAKKFSCGRYDTAVLPAFVGFNLYMLSRSVMRVWQRVRLAIVLKAISLSSLPADCAFLSTPRGAVHCP